MCVVGIEWWRGLLSEVKFSPSAQLRERKREGMATARAATSSATAVESVKLEDTLNRAWKDDKTGFGYRMLQKMGWKEDKGLGKNETGMAAAVKVSRREEGLGLGVSKDAAGNHGWSSTVSGFSAVLDLLNSTYGTQPVKSKKKSPSIQVRIKYGKMAAAKDLSTKSSKDLAAVLGHHPIAFPSVSVPTTESASEDRSSKKKKRKTEEMNSENGSVSSDNDSERVKKSKKKEKKRSREQDQVQSANHTQQAEEVRQEDGEKQKKKKRKKSAEE